MADTLKAFSPEDADRIERVVQWAERLMRAPAFGSRAAAPVVQDGGDRLVKVTSLTTTGPGLYPAKLQDGVWTYASPSFPADADAPDCYFLPLNSGDAPALNRRYHSRRLSLHTDGSIIYTDEIEPDGATLQTYGAGVGDTPTAAFRGTLIQFQQNSGITVVNEGGGLASVQLIPARADHAGAVSLAAQNLGTGTKGVADKLGVGFDVEAAEPEVWPGQTILPNTGGVAFAKEAVQSKRLACSTGAYGMDNATGRQVWMISTSFGGGGTGRFQVDTYHWTGAAYANDNRIQLDGDGFNLQFGVYRFFGNNGQTGTFKTVTAQAGLVMGGTATGTGFSGTIGG
jgi:hypothetical protein